MSELEYTRIAGPAVRYPRGRAGAHASMGKASNRQGGDGNRYFALRFRALSGERKFNMFATLEDEMRRDDAREVSQRERVLKYGLVALGSILLFGGLYYAIQLFV